MQGFAEETTPAPKAGMGFHGKGYAGDCPMMGDGDPGYGRNLNLTKEEQEKVDAERKAFRESTKDLKRDIYQKSLELQSEMAKKDTDSKKAFEIQKQLSDLKGQMDQKRLEHRFNLKKINPDLGSGMGGFHDGGKRAKMCPRKM
jgi:Spy/CpxP family protein refolding chaperone